MAAAVPDGDDGVCARPLSILMVSDFFYPNTGGVELHIYQLSQCLIARGHKVCVLTHAYDDRGSVRHMTNGLKVYYAPRIPVFKGSTLPELPGLFGTAALLRSVLLRERVDVVHGHQAFSSLAHQAVLHAGARGVPSVFTDHSLFGFSDASSILTNKVLQFTLSAACRVVCVSHTSKENTVLRAEVAPQRVSVIPNAVDGPRFAPDPPRRLYPDGRVVVVCMGRLEYRKGTDLLAGVLPLLCRRRPEVHFLVGGDGPKRAVLEAVVREHRLEGRVELLGDVPHAGVRSVLTRGHVFLNTSLTESFCMAALEAACAGLLVVATRVGGVPEILPPDMLLLAPPEPEALVEALEEAVRRLPGTDARAQHEAVCEMYRWGDVARRVEIVYGKGLGDDTSLAGRARRLRRCGPFAGPLFCAVVGAADLFQRWLDWAEPPDEVESAPSVQQRHTPVVARKRRGDQSEHEAQLPLQAAGASEEQEAPRASRLRRRVGAAPIT